MIFYQLLQRYANEENNEEMHRWNVGDEKRRKTTIMIIFWKLLKTKKKSKSAGPGNIRIWTIM